MNIHEAKTRLSALIQAVEAGEVVIIARAGKPVVVMKSFEQTMIPETMQDKRRRLFGSMKGQIWMSEDFDDPLPDDFWHDPEEDEYYS